MKNRSGKFWRSVRLAALVSGMPAMLSAQGTRYVSPTGAHIYPYTNWDMAATGIHAAVATANSNNAMDVVWVADGHYLLDETVAISNTKVRGYSGNPWQTRVDGNAAVRCFYLGHTNAELSGVMATNGHTTGTAEGNAGAGIFIGVHYAALSNCVVAGNVSDASGAGIKCAGMYVNVVNTHVIGNQALAGVAGGVEGYRMNFTGCIISNNTGHGINLTNACVVSNCLVAGNGSDGIRIWTYGDLSIHNTVISNNAGRGIAKRYNKLVMHNSQVVNNHGGGMSLRADVVISNSAICRNSAVYGAGLHCEDRGTILLYNTRITDNSADTGGGAIRTVRPFEFYNCTIASNQSVSGYDGIWTGDTNIHQVYNTICYDSFGPASNFVFYYSCATGLTGNGNITAPPSFVDPAVDNYTLAGNSPCRDAGTNQPWMDNALDLAGNRRVDRYSRRVDIGCYEYETRGSMFTIH